MYVSDGETKSARMMERWKDGSRSSTFSKQQSRVVPDCKYQANILRSVEDCSLLMLSTQQSGRVHKTLIGSAKDIRDTRALPYNITIDFMYHPNNEEFDYPQRKSSEQ